MESAQHLTVTNQTFCFLQALWDGFRQRGVEAVVLRKHEVDLIREGEDADILVRPGQSGLAAEVVRAVACQRGWNPYFCDQAANHLHLVFWKAEGGGLVRLQVDVQTALGRKGFRYASGAPLLASAEDYNGIRVPSRAGGAAALLLHAILDKGTLKPRYRKTIQECADDDLERFLDLLLPPGAADKAKHWVRSGMPEKQLPVVRGEMRRCLRLAYPLNVVRPVVVRLGRWFRFFGRRRGVLVAFLGPDGAGKTTTLAAVEQLIPRGPYPITTVYMGKRDPFLPTSWLIRKLCRERPERSKPNAPGNRPPTLVRRLADAIGLVNWVVDQWARYVVRIRPCLQQGGIVLTDRYSFDLANRSHWSLAFHPLFLRVVRLFFPLPDRTILLWETPCVLSERRGENSVAESAALLERLRLILRHVPDSMELRTNAPQSVLAEQIASHIAILMQQRCPS